MWGTVKRMEATGPSVEDGDGGFTEMHMATRTEEGHSGYIQVLRKRCSEAIGALEKLEPSAAMAYGGISRSSEALLFHNLIQFETEIHILFLHPPPIQSRQVSSYNFHIIRRFHMTPPKPPPHSPTAFHPPSSSDLKRPPPPSSSPCDHPHYSRLLPLRHAHRGLHASNHDA